MPFGTSQPSITESFISVGILATDSPIDLRRSGYDERDRKTWKDAAIMVLDIKYFAS